MLVLPEQFPLLQAWWKYLFLGGGRERLPRHPPGRAVLHRASVRRSAGTRGARGHGVHLGRITRTVCTDGEVLRDAARERTERECSSSKRNPDGDRGAECACRLQGG